MIALGAGLGFKLGIRVRGPAKVSAYARGPHCKKHKAVLRNLPSRVRVTHAIRARAPGGA